MTGFATETAPDGREPKMDLPTTILDALVWQAAERTDRPAFTVSDLRGETTILTNGDLLSVGLRVATSLRERGLRQGDRVMICLATSPDLLFAIFGVMLAGGVCVPIYPPVASQRLARWKERVLEIARVAQPCGAVIAPENRLHMAAVLEQTGEDLFVITPSNFDRAGSGTAASVSPRDLAFIQFTSGTTRRPRGVSITHASLMANVKALASGLDLDTSDVSVSWLPPYHDMGLVGHIFTPVLSGVHQHLMPPHRFLAKPERWLALISETGATQTTAPNSGYSMCVNRIEPALRGAFQLGSLRWALNGAELVQAETLRRFAECFGASGFSSRAFRPVYGLAEATLAATFSQPGGAQIDWVDRHHLALTGRARPTAPGGPGAQALVSVGRPIPEHELVLVRRGSQRRCDERQVGEIWFRGPSVMKGYFNNPQATEEAMTDGWLMTGDLGYQVDGALYVTGRIKELIIKGGRNYSPQEFEGACEGISGMRHGRVVAFGSSNAVTGTEDLVIVGEVRQQSMAGDPKLARRVVARVAEQTGLTPDRVELIEPGILPKTTSGKLQRGKVKAAYESGVPLEDSRDSLVGGVTADLRSALDVALFRLRKLLGWQ